MSTFTQRIKAGVPNTVTCMNLVCGVLACITAFSFDSTLCCGLTGMHCTMILIGAAAVFDFLDGFMARLLGAYSDLGKELDSLCDCVSFGVAPALLAFNALTLLGAAWWVAWATPLIAVMGALRLARFNIDTRQTTSFIGLPIPASALLWIGIVAWMQAHGYPGNGIAIVLVVGAPLLMVSNLPMFSLKFKNLDWRENFKRYALIAAAILFVAMEGLPGLGWTILFYIVASIVTARHSDLPK